jgi:ribonuclease HI
MKSISLYTDGSCDAEKFGGWASILIYKDVTKEFSGSASGTTSQRMELVAVIEGIRQVKEPCHIHIYSDSKYVVESIAKGWVLNWLEDDFKLVDGNPRKNSDLWIEYLTVSSEHNIIPHKVKGHSDNKMNNKCDWLAGMARRKLNGTYVE